MLFSDVWKEKEGGVHLSTENQSVLKFSLEESIWFQRGQEVDNLLSISLNPDITIQENEQYVMIRGALLLSGEYEPVKQIEMGEQLFTAPKLVHSVEERENGIYDFNHRFPIDITIPTGKIISIDEVYVKIDSFDYVIPERGCLKLTADISISGLRDEPRVLGEQEKKESSASPYAVTEEFVKIDEKGNEWEEIDRMESGDGNKLETHGQSFTDSKGLEGQRSESSESAEPTFQWQVPTEDEQFTSPPDDPSRMKTHVTGQSDKEEGPELELELNRLEPTREPYPETERRDVAGEGEYEIDQADANAGVRQESQQSAPAEHIKFKIPQPPSFGTLQREQTKEKLSEAEQEETRHQTSSETDKMQAEPHAVSGAGQTENSHASSTGDRAEMEPLEKIADAELQTEGTDQFIEEMEKEGNEKGSTRDLLPFYAEAVKKPPQATDMGVTRNQSQAQQEMNRKELDVLFKQIASNFEQKISEMTDFMKENATKKTIMEGAVEEARANTPEEHEKQELLTTNKEVVQADDASLLLDEETEQKTKRIPETEEFLESTSDFVDVMEMEPSSESSESESSSDGKLKKWKKKKEKKKSLTLSEFFARKEEEQAQKHSKMKVCIVQEGQTITHFSEKYDVNEHKILRMNNLDITHDIYAGQVLYIPVNES